MYYMGFYDLFDHLLDTNEVRGKRAAADKASVDPRPRRSKQSRRVSSRRKTDTQIYCEGTEALPRAHFSSLKR